METLTYNVNHDLDWLLRVCEGAKMENRYGLTDYEKGFNEALKWVQEAVNKGMKEAG